MPFSNDENETWVRRNGFQWPLHPLQVLAWVIFGGDVVIFLVLCLPFAGSAIFIAGLAVCHGASTVAVVVAAARTTGCNPQDPHLSGLRDKLDEMLDDDGVQPYCSLCNVPVHKRTKHCHACNKCVDVFDHHCMWLNNCIGRANYRHFIATTSSLAVMLVFVLGTCAKIFIECFTDMEAFEERVRSVTGLGEAPVEFILTMLVLLVVVNGPLLLLDLQLVGLHAFLNWQQLTTYEYFSYKRERQEMEQQGLDSEHDEARGGRRIVTLPSCLDWIIFSRCGKRKRRPKADPGASDNATPEREADEQIIVGRPVASIDEIASATNKALDASASLTQAGAEVATAFDFHSDFPSDEPLSPRQVTCSVPGPAACEQAACAPMRAAAPPEGPARGPGSRSAGSRALEEVRAPRGGRAAAKVVPAKDALPLSSGRGCTLCFSWFLADGLAVRRTGAPPKQMPEPWDGVT